MQTGTLYFASGWILAAGAICLVVSSRMFRSLEFKLPSHKFVRAAYVWLLIAGLLMCLERTHLSLTGLPFSHAYIGAIRHAVTVGFISQMILGVGLRVVGEMNDIPRHTMPALWGAFILINLGNALRVGLEVGTDYTGKAFMPMGITGFLELTGLILWAAAMLQPMLRSQKVALGA
jgi:hypothetical protein